MCFAFHDLPVEPLPMNLFLLLALTIVGSYLIGAIPFGYLVGRWRGIDIFQHGSGNIGATNVGRVLGRRFGILVFVLDFAKGAVPAAVALGLLRAAAPSEQESLAVAGLGVWAGMAAFLGHLFPLYLRFRGGKGVATGAGVVAVLMPLAALGAVITWLAVVCGSRYVSLASLTAAVALCGLQLALSPHPFHHADLIMTLFCFLAACLVFLRHRSNIVRLVHGNENRLPESPAMLQLTKTVHVLALGLWFGSAGFFLLVVAGSLFNTFQTIAARTEPTERPIWLPLPEKFKKSDNVIDGPREQGTRVAGAAVAPLFLWFFLVQGTCGLLATTTAVSWLRSHPGEKIHRRRTTLLLLALATVLIGFPLERKVSALRLPRDRAVDEYLQTPSPALAKGTLEPKEDFTRWHLASLGLSFVTLVLVTGSMALAARLPDSRPTPGGEPGA
jgi:acyl phosphate:glycerol-3-phosphate acyltransferase